MITASNEVQQLLREALSIGASTRVLAEWNMNRFVPVKDIVNRGYVDDPLFPIASIVEGRRPTQGILKGRTGVAVSTSPTQQEVVEGRASSSYSNAIEETRYYVASPDDPYKYYSSSAVASNKQAAFKYQFPQSQQPQIIYSQPVKCNKIVIGLDTTTSSPVEYSVQVTTNGTTWTDIIVAPIIDDNGQITLWLDDAGTWRQQPNYDAVTSILGLRLNVVSMDRHNAHLNVIEMSPRIENDLTDYVISWDADFSMSDTSFLLPIGRASSNTGSIELSNTDLRFNNDNQSSLYFDLIDKSVRFKVDFGVKKADGSFEYIRQLTMYAQSWAPSATQEITVDLKDSSSYAQEETVPATYMEGQTVGAIVWRLMDMMGYTNYAYEPNQDDSLIIPYFWTTGEESLWEVVSRLGEISQTAIYYDEYDVLQIKTKNAAYDKGRAIDWSLRATDAPGATANIIDLSQSNDFEANSVSVEYRETAYSDYANGFPKMEVSWQPEGTVLLRSAPLQADILFNSTWIHVAQSGAASWPYSGLVNVEGEIIRYEGKVYFYYDLTGKMVWTTVKSLDEKNEVDRSKSLPESTWKNYFSGHLTITKRGEYDSPVKDHILRKIPIAAPYASEPYLGHEFNTGGFWGASYAPRGRWNKALGSLRVQTDRTYDNWTMQYNVTTYKDADLVQGGARFGTRLKFSKDGTPANHGAAGLYILGGLNQTGVYIFLHTTAAVEAGGRWQNEVGVALRDRWGRYIYQKMAGEPYTIGAQQDIQPEVWYDLEATAYQVGQKIKIVVYLNGLSCGEYVIMEYDWVRTGAAGLTVKSHCAVDFEYVYALGEEIKTLEDPDNQTTFLDLIQGDYRSAVAVRDWKYKTADRYVDAQNYFYDEFSPTVHEIREYEVTFDNVPLLHSYLYFSNESQAVCTEYNADPFKARFTVVNASRQDAVMSGEDLVTFGVDNSVSQNMFVYGRLLEQKDAQTITVEDADGIRRRGKSNVTVESQWIQSKAMAQSLADWIVENWAGGCDEVSVETFYLPTLQIGDLVSVSHPIYNMSSVSHKYFVVGIKRSFSNDGPESSFVLRRARI